MRQIVKQTLDAEIQNFLGAQAPPIPFYDTTNLRQLPNDDLWVTTVYYTDYAEPNCYHHRATTETGVCLVSIFSRAGTSYVPATTLADEIEDYFRNYLGTDVEVVGTLSGSEVRSGDATGRFYAVDVELNYQHRY